MVQLWNSGSPEASVELKTTGPEAQVEKPSSGVSMVTTGGVASTSKVTASLPGLPHESATETVTVFGPPASPANDRPPAGSTVQATLAPLAFWMVQLCS